MSIDRASVVTNAILCVIYKVGLGEIARAEIVRILRDEFADVEHTAISEIHFRQLEDE
jgi:hypothetical protein